MKEYVCGFMFHDNDQVLLIQKERPDWQKGKLNGIGGKIEPGESPYEAMVREFWEETGMEHEDWSPFCELTGDLACSDEDGNSGWIVHFFKAEGNIHAAQKTTDEKPVVRFTTNLVPHCVPNLHWLIPLALADMHMDGRPMILQAKETY